MPKVEVNGIAMEYQHQGPNTGGRETIIFAHGAGGNLLSWFQQIPYFSRQYDCITFSHRGFGHSYDVKNGSVMKYFPDDLRCLMDALEIQSAHLVAQSMGGRTALGFVVDHPERADDTCSYRMNRLDRLERLDQGSPAKGHSVSCPT